MKYHSRYALSGWVVILMGLVMVASPVLVPPVFANHSVLVEGESDFDGDGLIGAEEDGDGDRIFGTINGGVANANQNGHVTIVTSGRFVETVLITAANGVTVLEAAPGVTAVVEAFRPGDNDNNASREAQPGIIVASNGNFPVEIRNLVSRNWTVGLQVTGDSRVLVDACKFDSNVNFGIQVSDDASVIITDSQVNATGFRNSGTLGQVQANPGTGIAFQGNAQGAVTRTTVVHSFAAGISAQTSGDVSLLNNTVANNNPNLDGF